MNGKEKTTEATPDDIPYIVLESAVARLESVNRRLAIAGTVALIVSNVAWMIAACSTRSKT